MVQNGFDGNWNSLLEQMGITDPATRQQWQMLAGMMNANQADTEGTDTRSRLARRARARKKLQRLQQEHETLLARNDDLAAALGACPDCWGESRGCQTCRGLGRPGHFPPEEATFNDYVVPVLERLGLVQPDQPVSAKATQGETES